MQPPSRFCRGGGGGRRTRWTALQRAALTAPGRRESQSLHRAHGLAAVITEADGEQVLAGELPIGTPEKFVLLVNLKTAKAIGVTIPPSILSRADTVIE